MLRIKHLRKIFDCSRTTAYRKMLYYKAVLNKQNVTILDFCKIEDLSLNDFYRLLKLY